MKLLSSVWLLATSWTAAFCRLLHAWDFPGKSTGVGCHFPSPGNLPDAGIEPGPPAFQADALTSKPPGKQDLTFIERKLQTEILAHFFKVSFLLKSWFFNFTLSCQFWNLASVSPTSGHSDAPRCYFILGVYLQTWILANPCSCHLFWVVLY